MPDRRPFRLTCSGVDRLRRRLRTLTTDLQLVSRPDSAPLDGEGLRGTRREPPGDEALCIGIQPAQ
jgi:hypothetical protein